jgi:hypothetical protein
MTLPGEVPGPPANSSSPAGHARITRDSHPGGSSRHVDPLCRRLPAQRHIVPAAGAGRRPARHRGPQSSREPAKPPGVTALSWITEKKTWLSQGRVQAG